MTSQTGTLSPEGVRTMFDRIAPVYDLMNRLMTAGLDQRWRRMTAAAAVRPGDRVLDACCGTGDLAVAAQAAGGRVTGLDFSEKMLERARRKSSSIEWMRGDLLELPFEDASFDAATVGFGVRNVADLERGLGELARILRRLEGHSRAVQRLEATGAKGRRQRPARRLVPGIGDQRPLLHRPVSSSAARERGVSRIPERISRAPASSSVFARSTPQVRAASAVVTCMRMSRRTDRRPSGLATSPTRWKAPVASSVACAPTGTWQPPSR